VLQLCSCGSTQGLVTYYLVYFLLGISPASICSLPTFRNPVSVPSSKAGCTVYTVHPAFEDGTDTGFRNVGKLQIDAGEIPRRKCTIFKSRRKSEIKYYSLFFFQNFRLQNTRSSARNLSSSTVRQTGRYTVV